MYVFTIAGPLRRSPRKKLQVIRENVEGIHSYIYFNYNTVNAFRIEGKSCVIFNFILCITNIWNIEVNIEAPRSKSTPNDDLNEDVGLSGDGGGQLLGTVKEQNKIIHYWC